MCKCTFEDTQKKLKNYHIDSKSIGVPTAPFYSLEGPWDIGDPVHEKMTFNSIKAAGMLAVSDDSQYFRADCDQSYWEYIRGVFWNDDPSGHFFKKDSEKSDDFSDGIKWLDEFRASKLLAGQGKEGQIATLTGRSHFGDLQFLHAMEVNKNGPALNTRNKVIDWAKFCYSVGSGEINPSVLVSNTGINKYSFPNITVTKLFNVTGKEKYNKTHGRNDVSLIVRQRAMGSLLHLIQDSYSIAHCTRAVNSINGYRSISQFGCYSLQDQSAHEEADKLPPDPLLGEIVSVCTQILQCFKAGLKLNDALPKLDGIFSVTGSAKGAGDLGILR